MKKTIIGMLLGILLIPMMVINVNATSVPYQWSVGGETVNVTKSNEAGTASVEKDGKTVTLFLKNYNGGELILECYGTGQSDVVFIIDLEGNNKIEGNNIGIDMGDGTTKIKFQGTGDLTIVAPKPISYESFTNKAYINPTTDQYGEQKTESSTTTKEESVETTGKEESVEKDVSEDEPRLISKQEDSKLIAEKVEDESKEDDNNLLIIFGIYTVVSLALIVGLILKISKMEKNIKES